MWDCARGRGYYTDTQTHRWFHSYAAVWKLQAVALHSLASAFLQGFGQQREAMDRCRVRLTLKKQLFPLIFLLLREHWAFPREREGRWKAKRAKRTVSETKTGRERLVNRNKVMDIELFLATRAVVKKKNHQAILLATWYTVRGKGGA